ncbi:IS5 family transposase [Aquabacterium sp.]|uniref:IS5 family transposase n=1 Tax=Aquabacterium sp. TaxID=1872578 RepID=UPI002487A107|nr:IS5 family transposase [Aquabacterium sp.]MDI1260953.1 IS5 family transposase [Aquabacterium sp.]
MSTPDFFRCRLAQMIDLKHPLAVLATRLPWAAIETAVAPKLARSARPAKPVIGQDLAGAFEGEWGGGISPAGRPRLPVRLMVSLLYLKHSFNLSDEEVVERWAENVQWQFFSGMDYYEPRLPCDATQIGRFRRLLGEYGLEQLLKATIDIAVDIKAVKPADLERVIVDSTVQSKAIAHPVDSRLLEIARHKVVAAAKRAGIALKQTNAQEGKTLRRKAGGYAHAKQFKRLRKTVKRQRTILGVVMREVQRKLEADRAAVAAGGAPVHQPHDPKALSDLALWLERAERIRTQQRNSKNKLYALHAPEVECISKGKARNPYEFGVKVSLAITHKQGLMVGARSFPGNPYDGHVLSAQLEQTTNLLQDTGRSPKQVIVDLGYRGVDADNPGVQIIHRGKYKSLSEQEKKLLKRRQAIEPLIGHTKADHRMDRCWLQGALGDALHALSCAAGYNIRWLLRAITRLGLKGLFDAFSAVLAYLLSLLHVVLMRPMALGRRDGSTRNAAHGFGLSMSVAVG